jgi:hypothetical protein
MSATLVPSHKLEHVQVHVLVATSVVGVLLSSKAPIFHLLPDRDSNTQRLWSLDTVNVYYQTPYFFLISFVISKVQTCSDSSWSSAMHASLTVLCATVQQMHGSRSDSYRSWPFWQELPAGVQEKPIKSRPWAYVTRLHQGGLDKLSMKTCKDSKEPRAG